MECRIGCGACCVAPSISSAIPGMRNGKEAGVRCVQLSPDNRCLLFGDPTRPPVCVAFAPRRDTCGHTSIEAMALIRRLEQLTS